MELCKNCGSEVRNNFCSSCGQKINIHTDPTVHDVIHDGIHEFLHLDGKIFKTIRYLFTRPGFLTKEFLQGRRASYIHPLRLYITMSLVYLLLPNFDYKSVNINIGDKTKVQEVSKTKQTLAI